MDEIGANQIEKLLQRRMGLLVGPGLTYYPGVLGALSKSLADEYEVTERSSYLQVADAALEGGTTEDHLRQSIRRFFDSQTPSVSLSSLAKVKWGSILSLALDVHLESRLKKEADRRPTRQTVTILDEASQVPPPKTIPSYKLLGVVDRERFACSTATYLMRRTGWRGVVKEFADRIKGGVVLCLGLEECPWAIQDLLAEMASQPSGAPSCLLFLADDPLRDSPIIRRLIGGRSRITAVRGSLGELLSAAAAADAKGYTSLLPFEEDQESPFQALRAFREVAVVVNDHLKTDISTEERHRLLELLFSPETASWAPFVHGFDLQRTLSEEIKEKVERLLALENPEFAYTATVLHGRAASGKTILLKRVAWELARSGALVLWLRTAFIGDGFLPVRSLFEAISKSKGLRCKKVVVIMDDPFKSTGLQPKDILSAAQAAGVQIVLLTSFRTSDWGTSEVDGLSGYFSIVEVEELSDELDAEEWCRLPAYLVSLGICPNEQDAAARIQGVPTRLAQDTLSMLYYLLPQTKPMIASSVKDEFFRLGDRAWLTNVLVGEAACSTALLKSAYEMVAVACHFRTPLPIEVLVSALEADYAKWLGTARPDGPAWGILYPEDFEEGETTSYRTRNAVVTRILVEAINGGSLGHSGELGVISRLLASCTGSTPAYREFCVRILVQNPALEVHEYEEVLQLYDRAIEALPHEDKTLLHHKALWIKKRGRDPIRAGTILDKALEAAPYPYARRGELDEHIHTTYAATVIDAIDQKKLRPGEGKQLVLAHLDKARTTKFLDPQAVHVQANLIVKLAAKEESLQSPDSFQLVGRALSDVDRALILLNNPLQERRREGDLLMLEQIREQVFLVVGSLEELKAQADRIWDEFGGQQGFVIAARKLFHIASKRNKGQAYRKAFEYCQVAMRKVTDAGVPLAPPLIEVALHVYYRWQIQRAQMNGLGTGRIEWNRVWELGRTLLVSPSLKSDPFYRYLDGLALAHLGEWPQAMAVFADLRNSGLSREYLWEPRDYLLGEEGGRRRVQGVMKRGGSEPYFYSEELHADFHVEKSQQWPREGEIAHAHIRFSFGGTRAYRCD